MMKKFHIALLLAALSALPFSSLLSQARISGRVTDAFAGAPLPGASIRVSESALGTSSDNNGQFTLDLPPGDNLLIISSIGYLPREVALVVTGNQSIDIGPITLESSVIGLEEVSIIASQAVERRTPVSVSVIRAETISSRLGDRPFPEIMGTVPGVYATRQGGGSGDASINIRGFKQENVALLLNGVPIGSVENGLVYWNNWLGLSEATRQIQVQRGLSASQAAVNSIGGTINIITKTTDVEAGGSFRYSLTDYGNQKFTMMLSSGKLKNNMAVTFLGSRFSGPGYVDATYVSGWAYYLSLSKEFNKDHMLVFTALGNPEKHGQRNFRLSKAQTDRYGIKYNREWGSYNGRINNASENFYHKPHLSLNHYWNITPRSFLATSYYLSFGSGGGKWTDTFGSNPWIFAFTNESGQIDWDAIYRNNATHDQHFTLADGTDTSGYSLNIQTNFLASHIWTGILSNYRVELGDHFRLMAGVHGRIFKSKLQQKVRDLLGGEFYIDDFAFAADGVAGREQIRQTGDIVKVDNGAMVNYAGVFGQLEYTSGPFNAFLAGTVSGNWYRREDRYNYVSDQTSEWVYRTGADVKAGANYNISELHNLYVNAGYFSRAPYYKFVFGTNTNSPTQDLKNEKNTSFEAGYGFNARYTRLRLNAYWTLWKDKSILTNEYNQFEDASMIQGLDARHAGAEAELEQRFLPWLRAGGSLSLGLWDWKNDVTAFIFNDDQAVVDTIQVYANGLHVGDAPQTQASAWISVLILKTASATFSWQYFDRFYADFSPTTRTDPEDSRQPYRIPAYQTVDVFLSCPFNIGKFRAQAEMNCYNILNNKYIVRGQDGNAHDADSFTGFWGFGRNFSFGLSINF